jgi:ferredoxin
MGSDLDIFKLLEEASEKKKRRKREQILESLDVEDLFERGIITIDKKSCLGVECKLCIDICPTYTLYWRKGEIGIDEDLCVYCTACVLCCCVDDCIHVYRRRLNGEEEKFSNPKHVLNLLNRINIKKRKERVESRKEEFEREPVIVFDDQFFTEFLKTRKVQKGL